MQPPHPAGWPSSWEEFRLTNRSAKFQRLDMSSLIGNEFKVYLMHRECNFGEQANPKTYPRELFPHQKFKN